MGFIAVTSPLEFNADVTYKLSLHLYRGLARNKSKIREVTWLKTFLYRKSLK